MLQLRICLWVITKFMQHYHSSTTRSFTKVITGYLRWKTLTWYEVFLRILTVSSLFHWTCQSVAKISMKWGTFCYVCGGGIYRGRISITGFLTWNIDFVTSTTFSLDVTILNQLVLMKCRTFVVKKTMRNGFISDFYYHTSFFHSTAMKSWGILHVCRVF